MALKIDHSRLFNIVLQGHRVNGSAHEVKFCRDGTIDIAFVGPVYHLGFEKCGNAVPLNATTKFVWQKPRRVNGLSVAFVRRVISLPMPFLAICYALYSCWIQSRAFYT
jgi:hypothetical protein